MVVGRRDMYSRSLKFHQDLHLFTNCLAVGKKMEVLKELLASTVYGGQSRKPNCTLGNETPVLDCTFSD